MLDKKQKLQAVLNNDSRYDGIFFYAVKSTGIFCRPSCASKPPLVENFAFFETAQNAQMSGYRPCKRCRPDLLEYDPQREMLSEAIEVISVCLHDDVLLEKSLDRIGINKKTLARLIKAKYGMTLTSYIRGQRIEMGKALLVKTDYKVIDIVFECGFGSETSFYRNFTKFAGMNPKAYRESYR